MWGGGSLVSDRRAGRWGGQRAKAGGRAGVTQVLGDQTVNNIYGPGSVGAPRALAALPAAVALVGRGGEVGKLLSLLGPGGADSSTVVVSAVAGLAGVGKSALALGAAHRAMAAGWFPGGVLFVDLRGYDPAGQVTGEQAVGAMIRALEGTGVGLPPTFEEQTGLYRSLLADRARRGLAVLVVADNASSAAQVEPLIPGSGVHRVLVTSRESLATLPGRRVDLTVLAPDAAGELVAGALRAADPADPRPGREPGALAVLADRCGFLPLALQIAAAMLKGDPQRLIADLVRDLEESGDRLAVLSVDDGAGLVAPVRAAFDVSFQRLPEAAARLLPLLALNPGPGFSTDAAGALAGVGFGPVRPVLAVLARAHLIEPVSGQRWRMHDLIRDYAGHLARSMGDDADGPERAVDRLLDYYHAACDAADDHLRALPGDRVPARFRDVPEALGWLEQERLNLIAAVHLAADASRPAKACALAQCLAVFLSRRRYFQDAVTIGQVAVHAAQGMEDGHGEGSALNNLGLALREVRRFEEAITAHQQAHTIYHDLGDRHSEGTALNNLNRDRQASSEDTQLGRATWRRWLAKVRGGLHT